MGTLPNLGYTLKSTYNSVYNYLLVGYGVANLYFINKGSELAGANAEVTETIANRPVTFLSNCSAVAVVAPAGNASDVSGAVTVKLHLATTAPVARQPYVRRSYDITPAAGANAATGRVTLFYSQADFDDFNANRGSSPELPNSPTDVSNKTNLRITQYHGSSSTGVPGSYTGWTGSGPAVVLIDPSDDDIVWNSFDKRWQVSFAVTGFSGFFAHSGTTPLPIQLTSFTAQKAEGVALLEWKTSMEVNASHFEIERAINGKHYNTIGSVEAASNSSVEQHYSFKDNGFSALNQVAYYRLRSVDRDGSYVFSRVQSLQPSQGLLAEYIYPNPAIKGSLIRIKSSSKASSIQVYDMQGHSIDAPVRALTDTEFAINADVLIPGTYLIKFELERGAQTRKLVIK